MVFDLTAPVIAGIANNGECCISAELSFDDANLEKVQIDGADVAAVDRKYTLEPGTHTVSVTDKSGNVTTVRGRTCGLYFCAVISQLP